MREPDAIEAQLLRSVDISGLILSKSWIISICENGGGSLRGGKKNTMSSGQEERKHECALTQKKSFGFRNRRRLQLEQFVTSTRSDSLSQSGNMKLSNFSQSSTDIEESESM